MMAPVCMVSRRPCSICSIAKLYVLCLVTSFMCSFVITTAPSNVYDRDFPLGIGEYVTCPCSGNDEGYKHSSDSSTLFGIPIKLCCVPDCDIHKRKRHYRKRGRRGGHQVHLKRLQVGITSLASNLESYHRRPCVPELGLLCTDCGSLEE